MVQKDKDQLLAFVTRVINDASFRIALQQDPAKAMADAGFEVTPERLQAFKALNFANLQDLAAAFGHPGVTTLQ